MNCTEYSVGASTFGTFGGEIQLKVGVAILASLCLALWILGTNIRKNRIYLLDFACYKAPASLETPLPLMVYGCQNFQLEPDGPIGIGKESIDFQSKILLSNGVADRAYSPPWMHSGKMPLYEFLGGESCMLAALRETRMVLYGAVREVLEKTGVHPTEIDYIVVNSSLFNPSPTMADLVIEKFGMRPDVEQFFLAGMGCSAGIISVDLASHLLGLNKDKYALVLCTENLTQNWYRGKDRDKQIPNTLFRMGASATLLTNKRGDRKRSKYVLEHIVKVHQGADTTSYRCVYQMEDSEGIKAVRLNKDIVKVAAKALQKNLTLLAPLTLPYSELLKFVLDLVLRMVRLRRGKPYQPDFRKAFQHFSLHAGGRGVIEGLGSQLKLTKRQLEPSFASLYFYGNTSSASYFYGVGYAECHQGIKKGDRVWQVGFGSGFKVNSAVWKALRSFRDREHIAWSCVTEADVKTMWSSLERMGVKFVNGAIPPHTGSKKPTQAQEQPNT